MIEYIMTQGRVSQTDLVLRQETFDALHLIMIHFLGLGS